MQTVNSLIFFRRASLSAAPILVCRFDSIKATESLRVRLCVRGHNTYS